MHIFETNRLLLSRFILKDAPFILELVNDPAWIRFIGDRGIRTLKAAEEYIRNGPKKSYAQFDFGLYLVKLKETGIPIGMCGLLRRDTLDDVDIGFAFLPQYTGKGYGFESAATVINHARDILGMKRILAITSVDNTNSIKLLEKLGFKFAKMIRLTPDAGESRLFEMIAGNKKNLHR
ncbi:MAG TPA: GNAT family N-acetyltransferase [Ferruginibacter sp.]|nr:GNAT family N-acetyltransferase [Ferruginibacter sp.]